MGKLTKRAASVIVGLAGLFAGQAHTALYVSLLIDDEIAVLDSVTGAIQFLIDLHIADPYRDYLPSGVTVGPDDDIFVTTWGDEIYSVLRFDSEGNFLGTFVAPGAGGLGISTGLAFGPDGHLYVLNSAARQVLRFDGGTGAFIDVFAHDPLMTFPRDLVFTTDNQLLVTSPGTDSVFAFDAATGASLGTFGAGIGLDGPAGITQAPSGLVYVVSAGTRSIVRFDPAAADSAQVFPLDGLGRSAPNDVRMGPNGNLFVSTTDDQIVEYDIRSLALIGDFGPNLSGGSITALAFSEPPGGEPNARPQADAGADHTATCASGGGRTVTLDGSGSFDPDGDPLTFDWAWDDRHASGETVSVELPIGTTTVTLTVSDGILQSSDSVEVHVQAAVDGFHRPLSALVPAGSNPPLPDKPFKHKRTLPLKLTLACEGGTGLGDREVAPPYIAGLRRAGASEALPPGTDLDSGAANNQGVNFRFAGGSGRWLYNLSTKTLEPGRYTITVGMPDGRLFDGAFVLR